MIDITMLENSFGNELGKQLLELYLSDHAKASSQLIEYYGKKNHQDIFSLTHNLCNTLTNLYEDNIISQLQYIKNICENGVLPTPTEITNIAQELEDITEQMENYIA